MDSTPKHSIYGGAGPTIMAVTWTEACIALMLVFARLYAASIRQGELRWDFFWVAVASVFALTSLVLLTIACSHGLGQHIWYLDLHDLTVSLKYFWAAACFAIFGIAFAKVAIIALLLALRAPGQKKRGYFLHFLWITNILFAAAITILIYTQCTPAKAAWDITIPGADCHRRPDALNFGYAQGAWAALTDIALAIYPISVVWSLQTTLKMKIGFCLLMSGGLVTALGSILRSYYIKTLTESIDITYGTAHFMIWGGTEVWLLIILGSIPPLRPLFSRLFKKTLVNSNGEPRRFPTLARSAQPTMLGSGPAARRITVPSRRDRTVASTLYAGEGMSSQEDILSKREQGADTSVSVKDGIVVHSTFGMTDMKTEDFLAEREGRRKVRRDFA